MWPRIGTCWQLVTHACVCRITNLLLLVTGSTSLQAWACSCQVRGRANTENIIIKKCTNKPVKRFEMKSNGCRDVQHTGLQSTQTRRNAGKQGAQTRGTRHIFPIIPISASGCMIIVGYVNQFKVTTNWKKLLRLTLGRRVTVLALSFVRSFIRSVHRAAEMSGRFYALVRLWAWQARQWLAIWLVDFAKMLLLSSYDWLALSEFSEDKTSHSWIHRPVIH